MANGIHQYRLGRSRLSRGLLDGFSLGENGTLTTVGEGRRRFLFLPGLDSAEEDCPWGRFVFHAQLQGDVVLTVRAFATNDDVFLLNGNLMGLDDFLLDGGVAPGDKMSLFAHTGGVTSVGASDLLLHGQNGRRLFLCVELSGAGSATLGGFRALTPGDNFYRTFPTLYQNDGEFLHRYLSIFSSLYSDLQDRVDTIPDYLDLDTAPAEALPLFARWLGLELDGNFLDEDHLRRLLKLMPELIKSKGSRRAVELLARLFVDEPVYLVERNLLNRNQLADRSTLYGDSPYDFTLLISRRSDELLRARLEFLIDQFKPLRSRPNIVFLGDYGGLDAFSYLDLNAALLQSAPGHLDDGSAETGMTYLK